jgi:hypothetical protein
MKLPISIYSQYDNFNVNKFNIQSLRLNSIMDCRDSKRHKPIKPIQIKHSSATYSFLKPANVVILILKCNTHYVLNSRLITIQLNSFNPILCLLPSLPNSHVTWVPLSSPQGASSSCRWRRRSPGMEGSCEYIQYAVADSRQVVVIKHGSWANNSSQQNKIK